MNQRNKKEKKEGTRPNGIYRRCFSILFLLLKKVMNKPVYKFSAAFILNGALLSCLKVHFTDLTY